MKCFKKISKKQAEKTGINFDCAVVENEKGIIHEKSCFWSVGMIIQDFYTKNYFMVKNSKKVGCNCIKCSGSNGWLK